MPETPTPQEDLSFEQKWQQITDSSAVAKVWLEQEVERLSELKGTFRVTEWGRSGNKLVCEVDGYMYKVAAALPEKSRVLISCTKKPQASLCEGVIISHHGSWEPLLTIELKEGGTFFKGGQVKLAPMLDTNKRKKQHEELNTELKDETAPMAAFRHGEFPTTKNLNPEVNTNLDDSQNAAYSKAMDIENTPVLFIHGGPGTGKTRTVCEIIKGHVEKERRVLVLSHSNKGSQVPALKLKEEKFPVHIGGRSANKIDPKLAKQRIWRKRNFPKAKIKKLNAMTAAEVAESMGAEDVRDLHLSTKEAKKLSKESIVTQFLASLDKAYEQFKKKMEKGGAAFSTLNNSPTDHLLHCIPYDVIIIDEATRLKYWHLFEALEDAGKQIILVGDPLQLGNIPLEPQTKEKIQQTINDRVKKIMEGTFIHDPKNPDLKLRANSLPTVCVDCFEEGPFASAINKSENPEKELPYVFLENDRRSLPNIVKILSELIYDGKLKPGREAKEKEHEGIVQWIDTSDLGTEETTKGTSKINSLEAKVVAEQVLKRLFARDEKQKLKPEDIGVIATYSAQAKQIRKILKRRLGAPKHAELLEKLLPNIDTVDAFQGDERKVIFVSTTRSNEEGNIGFLEEKRRLGVAIGRAQEELYIVGDLSTIVDNNEHPDSKQFFTQMKGLFEEHGEIKKEHKKKKPRKRKRKSRKKPGTSSLANDLN